MSEEEPNLSAYMQKLKIMPRSRPARTSRDDDSLLKMNPFGRRHKTKTQSNLTLFGPACACKRNKHTTIKNATTFKRPTNKLKILRDPIIVFVDNNCTHIPNNNNNNNNNQINYKQNCANRDVTKLFGGKTVSTQQDFKSIIAGCEQLSLNSDKSESDSSTEQQNFTTKNFRELRSSARCNTEQSVSSSSCSQQAMTRLCLNPPCDVTIDELASYFETFVHIPKKMSSMAEMMYI